MAWIETIGIAVIASTVTLMALAVWFNKSPRRA